LFERGELIWFSLTTLQAYGEQTNHRKCLQEDLVTTKSQLASEQRTLQNIDDEYRQLREDHDHSIRVHAHEKESLEVRLSVESTAREAAERQLQRHRDETGAMTGQILEAVHQRLSALGVVNVEQDPLTAVGMLIEREADNCQTVMEESQAALEAATEKQRGTKVNDTSHDLNDRVRDHPSEQERVDGMIELEVGDDTLGTGISQAELHIQEELHDEESQELSYGQSLAAVAGTTGQEESQELPYDGKSGHMYLPMSQLMHGRTEPEIPDSHGLGNNIQAHTVDSMEYILEESQSVHKRISGALHVTPTMASAPFPDAKQNRMNWEQANSASYKALLEATSPVGDTQGLFPLTRDFVASTPRSRGSNDGSEISSVEFVASTKSRVTHRSTRTPNHATQVRDASFPMSSSQAKPSYSGATASHQGNKQREARNDGPDARLRSDNKFKSSISSTKLLGDLQGSAGVRSLHGQSKSILKKRSDDGLKRKATPQTPSNTSKTRKLRHETQDLGPIIDDTQISSIESSQKKVVGAARKSTRRKSQGQAKDPIDS
jgi:hypothetical protein